MTYKQKLRQYIKLKQHGGNYNLIEEFFPELISKIDIKTKIIINDGKNKDLIITKDIIEFIISNKFNTIKSINYIELINKSLIKKNLDKLYYLFTLPIKNNIDLIIRKIKNDSDYKKFNINNNKSLYNRKTFIMDPNKKELWIKSQENNDAKILAKFMLKITRHVNYQEFQDKLLESICRIPTDKKYVIVIPNIEEKKSNKWISAILLDQINNNNFDLDIIDVISNINIGMIYFYSLYNEYLDFIICDDGSYSGGQITTDMQEIFNNCSSLSKIITYCLLPFVSSFAESRINKLKNVILLNSSKIESIKERCEKLNIESIELTNETLCIQNDDDYIELGKLLNLYFPNIKNNYNYELFRGNMPFYFDHKIADFVSSFPTIYQYGIVKSKENILLFNNCDHVTTEDGINEINFNEQCIIPYYKTLNIEIIGNNVKILYDYTYYDIFKNMFSYKNI